MTQFCLNNFGCASLCYVKRERKATRISISVRFILKSKIKQNKQIALIEILVCMSLERDSIH